MHFLLQSILFVFNLAVPWLLYFQPSSFVTISVYICYFCLNETVSVEVTTLSCPYFLLRASHVRILHHSHHMYLY